MIQNEYVFKQPDLFVQVSNYRYNSKCRHRIYGSLGKFKFIFDHGTQHWIGDSRFPHLYYNFRDIFNAIKEEFEFQENEVYILNGNNEIIASWTGAIFAEGVFRHPEDINVWRIYEDYYIKQMYIEFVLRKIFIN